MAGSNKRASTKLTVMTIGHSTHALDEFIRLLEAHDVERVVDIRTVPRSRRNPQFNRDSLPERLRAAGIRYVHLRKLGGLRATRPDSRNLGWENASFRGFADYMQTEEFARGLERLLKLAREKRSAIMCAEAVPWRCHRSLVADALLVRGVNVEHVMSGKTARPHTLTGFAQVRGNSVTYPAERGSERKKETKTPTLFKAAP